MVWSALCVSLALCTLNAPLRRNNMIARRPAMVPCAQAGEGVWSTSSPTTSRRLNIPDIEPSGDESRDLAILMGLVCDQLKAEDIVVLHVAPLVSWTSYIVLVTVKSRPQMLAVQYRCEEAGIERLGRTPREGKPGKSEWEMMDFGDVVVSIMTPEQREFYDLESFYGQAEEVELPLP